MPYYMILYHAIPSGVISVNARINGVSASDYSNNTAYNGSGGGTTGDDRLMFPSGTSEAYDGFGVGYLQNVATEEKLFFGHTNTGMGAGAGTAPSRYVTAGKWADTSNAVDEFEIFDSSGTDLGANSELIVLGFDPDGTDTSGSFWEELVNITYGSDQTVKPQIDTGVFDAKKYLWIQAWIKESTDPDTWFGYGASGTLADSSGSYSWRYNDNGGTDGAITNATTAGWGMGATTRQLNFFIVNNSAEEKLYVGNVLGISATGSASVPIRREFAGKGVDTSDPIRRIAIGQTTYTAYAGTTIKVWGSD